MPSGRTYIGKTLPAVGGVAPVYEYTYDAQGNQLSIKDPNGNVTRFTYDDNGNQLTRTLPDGSTEYFEYDARGRLARQTSFEGVVTEFVYDNYGRLASKVFTQKGVTETWIYTYDALGRVIKVDQNGRFTQTTYDAQGRTVSIQTPEGTVSYTYDKFGRQASVQADNDLPTCYTYDKFGRLATVTSDGVTTRYEYDVYGNIAKTVVSNGVTTTYQYDNMNRLTKLLNFVDANSDGVWNNGEERISQFDYTLDNLGRKAKAIERFGSDENQKNIVDWTYDAAGRLVQEVFDHYVDQFDQTSQWEYDLVGNRLLQKVDKGNDNIWDAITTYFYDANDRLLKEIFDDLNENSNDRYTAYTYDATQQTGKTVREGTTVSGTILSDTTFEYDAQGRMFVVTTIKGTRTEIVKYEYGADGIRVSAENEIWENGSLDSKTRTEYINDSRSLTGYSQVLKTTEFDSQENVVKTTTYVIGHQRISQTVETNAGKEEHYFTFDGHGSTRVLVDFAGTVVQLYSFDAYGNALGFDPALAKTEFLYSGEQFDAKIGQQYLRARYYDPATGRFNQLDPFFGNKIDPQSLHKYAYVHGDPIQGVDPTGLEFSIGGMMSSLGIGSGMRSMHTGAMFATLRTAGTLGLLTAGANIGTVGAVFANITQDPIPKGFMCSFGLSAATHGFSGGVTLSFYADFKTGKVSIYLSHAAGLAPVSYFKKQVGFGVNSAYGYIFRSSSPDDIEGLSVNSSFPLVSFRHNSFWNGIKGLDDMQFGYAMRTLANYLSPMTRYTNRAGAIQTMQSLESGTCGLFYAFRTFSFQAAVENTIRVFDIDTLGILDSVRSVISEAISFLPKSLDDMNNPVLSEKFHNAISQLDDIMY